MLTIFSQEYATAMLEKTTREEAFAEGVAGGEARGRAEGLMPVALNMLRKKFSFVVK